MGLTAMYVVMILMAKALVIHAQSCEGKCNIVFCGQTGLIHATEHRVAQSLRLFCYTNDGYFCGSDCNLGLVYYKKKVYDVCPMVPRTKNKNEYTNKKKCARTAMARTDKEDNATETDNRLDLCFQRVNEDDELMARVDTNCKYTVVMLANARLTNSHIPTLKAQARRLKKNCAKILCFYVLGDEETYDPTYDEICDVVERADYDDYGTPTFHFVERVHKKLDCCPSSSNGSASCCQT